MSKGRKYFLYGIKSKSRTSKGYFHGKAVAQALADDFNESVGWQQYAVGTAIMDGDKIVRTEPEGIKTDIPQLEL